MNPWSDPRPFDLGPRDAPVAFVLIHGFTGSPAEMRPLGEALAQRGFRAVAPLLPGHGSHPDDLAEVAWRDWLDGAARAFEWVAEHPRVIACGLSMGGLIVTHLVACRTVNVDGVVLLAPAYEVADPLFRFARLGALLLRSIPAPNLPRAGLTSEEGWKKLWHYDERPTHAIWQLRQLQQRTVRIVPLLQVPALVVQGALDQTLVPEGARRAVDRMPDARLLWLPRSGHCLTADVELDDVLVAVEELVYRLLNTNDFSKTVAPVPG